ncbi:melanotransferrin [Schistocerca gregaria]|uniref:melanotransferrin n=1 Tax=Schistocerca gregaria TaxID=7010 RepID=UPI00211DF76F|nr:melanotransferrin [Schistocerca gregaria]
MSCSSRLISVVFVVTGSMICCNAYTQGHPDIDMLEKMTWCTTSSAEQRKCKQFADAVDRDKALFGPDLMKLDCVQAFSREECMTLLDEEKADIISLDAGEVFIGGRYHSLVPIMQEVHKDGQLFYYAVAVVKRGNMSDVHSLNALRGKRACFGSVGTMAGWVIPVYTLMREGGMEVIDCNNHVKSAINFFGPSCAVNSLIDKYNPIGDNSDQLCQLCASTVPGQRCTSADPYADSEGAFQCLLEAGDVAFLKHTTVDSMLGTGSNFAGVLRTDFELLCRDGSHRTLDEYANCNWGRSPTNAVVTTSAKNVDMRYRYQKFLKKAVQLYGKKPVTRPTSSTTNQNGFFGTTNDVTSTEAVPIEAFQLFFSPGNESFVSHNLLFQDETENLFDIKESSQTYKGYLSDLSMNMILGVRKCPVAQMRLCVTSEAELDKCVKMRIALKAQLLKPEMVCYKGHSQIHCMQAIASGIADVAVFDAGDVYTAGLNYGLVPFLSEVYNLGAPEYYVVAVAKEQDPSTEITYLKGKYTCHTGINTGAGWVVPLAYLISNGWMRSYGCNSIRAAAEYFGKSCVPGALSKEYNTALPYENMCHLCHGVSFRNCRRDASEDYYGHTGAFRCLVEGGGDVAFVKHTTVMENTDGKRREWWARNTLTDDFELLCPDGTRASMHEYERCNLGKVEANAIVARGRDAYNETEINAFINLFIYAQQFYGRKDPDEFTFSMFQSPPPYSDLIFQDAAQLLQVVPPSQRNYGDYLGDDFLRARRIVDCQAGAATAYLSFLSAIFALLLARL